jgi:hypothetical protein
MSATVYYNNSSEAIPLTPVSFLNASGTATDPSSVTCVVIDPTQAQTTYTYNGSPPHNTITRASAGVYNLSLTGLTLPGLWTFIWIGTGSGVQQTTPGTFRLVSLSDTGLGMSQWYCGMEELKSRLSITDSTDDYEIQLAISAVTDWISTYCGRHFYQIAETRTFRPDNVWNLYIGDIVTCTQLSLDYTGDGVYDTLWTENVNFQLFRFESLYNVHSFGVERPRNYLQVLQGQGSPSPAGGQWLPWLWPFTDQNRVQIEGVWGWPSVPPNVTQAALILAADLFKAKDAPWGIAGVGDLGLVKVQSSPWAAELLRPYISVGKVGVL